MKVFNKMWVIVLLLVVFMAGHAVNANELRPNVPPPTVSSTIPASGAKEVVINRKISATFSEVVDSSTIEKITFTLNRGSASVHGKLTYVGVTAIFTPSNDLEPNAEYTATIKITNKNLAGNKLTDVKVWSFSTGSCLDGTAPTVSFTVPENNGTDVAVNRLIPICNQDDTMLYSCHGGVTWQELFISVRKKYIKPVNLERMQQLQQSFARHYLCC